MDKKYTENDLAIVQMPTIHFIFQGGGMDINTALSEMSLLDEKYAKIADDENLPYISKKIRELIKES